MNQYVRPMPLTDERDASGKKIPFSDQQRINHKDHFELSYLRWRYFMKSPNPPRELIERYRPLVRKLANQNYKRFRPLYSIIGKDIEDIENIGLIQLVSYLGLFSVEHCEEKAIAFEKDAIARTGSAPTIESIRKKDLSDMSSFISQRLLDVARVCSQKNDLVAGGQIIYQMFVLIGEEREGSDANLLENPAYYGYKKLSKEQAAKVRRGIKFKLHGSERFTLEGKVYRLVYETKPRVNLEGIHGADELLALNPQDTVETQDKMDALIFRSRTERLADKFRKLPKKRKQRFLTKMIKILETRADLKEELVLANEMLSKIR